MQFINLSIFLVVAAVAIAILKPKSKTQVWLFSIFIPIVFSFLYGYGAILISGSKLPIAYQLGGFIGGSVPSIIVSILVLLFCLKKKLKTKEEFKYPRLIIIPIIICALIGGIMLYIKHKADNGMGEYFKERIEDVSLPNEYQEQKYDETSGNYNESVNSKTIIENLNKEKDVPYSSSCFLSEVKRIDDKCPFNIGEYVECRKVVVIGTTLLLTAKVNDSSININDNDFKQKIVHHVTNTIGISMTNYLNKNDYSISCMIYDKHNQFKNKIAITPKEILSNY